MVPIIDVHCHYGEWPFPIKTSGVPHILKMMEKFGIEKCLISSAKAIVSDIVQGNAEVERIIDKHPQLLGYVVINPNYPEVSREEAKLYLSNRKFVGVKIHPDYSGQLINSEANKSLLKSFLRYNKPLLVHGWGKSGADAVAEVGNEFANLKIIMGHMGGSEWKEGIRVAKSANNIYLEPCCSYPDKGKIEQAVGEVGANRILFGSDLTLINPAFVIGMIEDADISDEDKEKVFYKNAKALFSL